MKGLIKNYIDKLTIFDLKNFALKNNINLNEKELKFLLNLTKENFEDILINENKYLDLIKNNITPNEVQKIKDLYFYYKNKYKGYLF